MLFTQPLLTASTLLHRASLDARLAAGEDPEATPELALRAQQLSDLTTRRSIGRAVLARLESTEVRWSLTSAVPVSREVLEESRPVLEQLAVALSSPEPARPEGVAQVLVLLRDGAGPLYANERDGSPLYFAVRRALLAMRPCSPSTVELVEHGEGY